MVGALPPSLSLMVISTGPLRQEKAGFFPGSEVYKTMLPLIPVSDFISKVKTTVPDTGKIGKGGNLGVLIVGI